MTPVFGLYYRHENRVVSLPLLNVSAEASIKELAAQVQLIQIYASDAKFPIEAAYSFPIPNRAAVCSFVMIKQDGTRIVGVVQEKQEARETYESAVSQGQQASLLEQQTPDVFQVSVGNIPPNEQVKIELVYATELAEDEESDSIRFHLPVHIGARYGQGPSSPPSQFRSVWISSSSPTPFLNIAMSIEAQAPIAKIGSPSHTVSTELGPDPKLPNFKKLPFSNYARVSLSSDSALDKDFVLTIKSAGLDAPRCIAELHPAHDTVALGLSLVPRFKLPDVSRQEFVLLVDRSGSMRGKRIEAAKKALIVLLRAIPHQDSLFQIVSFGTRCTSLWPNGSKPYNQETLEQATHHVDGMRADYGGTEIRAALHETFRQRKTDRPMSVLVLTDGHAWDLDGVLNEVKSAVEGAPKKAYVRVSVLGIGNSASTAMCEGIARLGNGTCMMVGKEEVSFTGKVARMLKAAKAPPISNISVDWSRPDVAPPPASEKPKKNDDDDFELVEDANEKKPKKTLNIFDESIDDPIQVDSKPAPPPPEVVLPPPYPVQQAPYKIQNLFPNIRLNIYAILQGKTVPQNVILRGETIDGAEIELPIPVTLSHLQNAPDAPPAMHALAARKIIQDLEDGKHGIRETLAPANRDDADLLARTVKASIVRLGKTYSISSTHTSFVAVDPTKPEKLLVQPVVLVPQVEQENSDYAALRNNIAKMAERGAPLDAPMKPSSFLSIHSLELVMSARRSEKLDAPMNPSAHLSTHSLGSTRSARRSKKSASSSLFGKIGEAVGALFGGSSSSSSASAAPALARSAALAPSGRAAFSPKPGRASGKSQVREEMIYDCMPDSALGEADEGGATGLVGGGPSSLPAPTSHLLGTTMSHSLAAAPPPPPAAAPRPSDPLEALARLQAFDGCFSMDVLKVVKLSAGTDVAAVKAAFPAGASDAVIATVLAMAFLAHKLGARVERDAWEGMYEKAQQYVEVALQSMGAGESVEVLEAKAVKMLEMLA